MYAYPFTLRNLFLILLPLGAVLAPIAGWVETGISPSDALALHNDFFWKHWLVAWLYGMVLTLIILITLEWALRRVGLLHSLDEPRTFTFEHVETGERRSVPEGYIVFIPKGSKTWKRIT